MQIPTLWKTTLRLCLVLVSTSLSIWLAVAVAEGFFFDRLYS